MSKRIFVVVTLLMLAACSTPSHVQLADAAFDSRVRDPRFPRRNVTLLFDDAHENFHRSDGRYAPFVTLMKNDGLAVRSNTSVFTEESLSGHDVLVIVNAEGAEPASSAFTEAEVNAVSSWVQDGGGLLLVADHSPFGIAANALSERLGVRMLDGHLKDAQNSDPDLPGPFFLLFTRENGLLGVHEILAGRREEERIERIVTFGGQALLPSIPVQTLLALSASAEIVKDRDKPESGEPIPPGAVQAVAFELGRGRVVILGEAAALTAQVITGDAAKAAGKEELRIGMSRGDLDNKQFALNIVRWLAR